MDNLLLPKILVVEDTEETLDAYRVILRGLARILIASTLEEAEDLLSQHNDFSLITWDFNLPDGNTLELIKATRARFPELPMLAASDNFISRGCQLKAGCDFYCLKPDVGSCVQAVLYPTRSGAMTN
jgi:CheY-like chemotaxis protein